MCKIQIVWQNRKENEDGKEVWKIIDKRNNYIGCSVDFKRIVIIIGHIYDEQFVKSSYQHTILDTSIIELVKSGYEHTILDTTIMNWSKVVANIRFLTQH